MQIIYKHCISLVVFLSLTIYFFNPVIFENKKLKQHDIEQWKNGANEIIDYRKNTNKEALWTNSMFSGMPAYLIDVKWKNDIIIFLHKLLGLWLPHPVSLIFISFISFYFMLICFGVRPEISIFGAIAFTLSTYMIVGINAGHNTRIGSAAFIPLIIAGVHLCFHKKRNLGFIITALSLALQLRLNHLQITYYTLIILIFYGISQLIYFYKKDELKHFFNRVFVLIIASFLAIGTFFGEIWSILEYSKYSIRGQSDLIAENSGLSKEYAFQYSNGVYEPLTLFFPHILGGSSRESLSKNSNLGRELKRNNFNRDQINKQLRNAPMYWGDQPIAAPYYVGALFLFLFILSIILLKPHEKYWLIGLLVSSVLLSMGSNFALLNEFIFDYLPGYNKFRSLTFIIIISIFSIVLIGLLTLEKFISNKEKYKKQFIKATLYTLGIYLFLYITSFFLSFSGPVDSNFSNIPDWFLNALINDRKALYVNDIIKGVIMLVTFSFFTYLFIYNKIKKYLYYSIIIIIGIYDMTSANKNFLKNDNCNLFNDCSFTRKKINTVNISEADEFILENNSQRKRVLNLQNTFNEANTSYYHSSIGGYHGAKLRRYQDLIENIITNERSKIISKLQNNNIDFSDLNTLNMLNTGYIKFNESKKGVIKNNFSNGNAWFISKLNKVNSPIEELNLLKTINTKNEAIIDVSKFGNFSYNDTYSNDGKIEILEYFPNKIKLKTYNNSISFIVFSEIYYPKGWNLLINGNNKEILRVNYVLRGTQLEAGENIIELTFSPNSYNIGNTIILISSIILLLLIIVFIFIETKKSIQ